MRPTGWRWFCAWAVAGGLLAFALLSGASIGFLMLPFAAIAVWLVGRTARMWPESLGSLAGAGALCLAVAAANRDYVACPDGPITLGPARIRSLAAGSIPCRGSSSASSYSWPGRRCTRSPGDAARPASGGRSRPARSSS